jgi:hypothetical protein
MDQIISDEERDAKYVKHNMQVSRQRMGLVAFVVGLAIGFLAAERFYLYQIMADGKLPPWNSHSAADAKPAPKGVELPQQEDAEERAISRVLVEPTAQQSAMKARTQPNTRTGQPTRAAHSRNELPALLETIAPDKEVMIAVSDYNLVREGMLTTWIDVRQALQPFMTFPEIVLRSFSWQRASLPYEA